MVRLASPGSESETTPAAVLADLAGLPYFQVDADRNVVAVSPAMERLTGFEAADVVGRSCLRLHRCTECLAGCGVFDHGEVTDKHLELYRADGATVQVRKSGRVFRDQDGAIVGAIEVVERLGDGETRPDRADERGDRSADAAGPDEAARITQALQQARYHREDAARALGMSRTTLWRKMKEYGL